MKYQLTIFILTLCAGMGLGSSQNLSSKVNYYLHHDCVRWDEKTLERSFTLDEIRSLLGKKVRFKNSKSYPENFGHVRMLYVVGYDKFLLMIDWEINPKTGTEGLRLYGKDSLPDLEFEE